ncbi:hypothetical protein EMCRGX_G016609 [Ephydatia muelleri]
MYKYSNAQVRDLVEWHALTTKATRPIDITTVAGTHGEAMGAAFDPFDAVLEVVLALGVDVPVGFGMSVDINFDEVLDEVLGDGTTALLGVMEVTVLLIELAAAWQETAMAAMRMAMQTAYVFFSITATHCISCLLATLWVTEFLSLAKPFYIIK